ncbi:AP-1 complex-associated regulatory protein isoform X1 [Channa argus]|uniref:AP-1 complex-associated regulatory protein isoform X1 n=1 Tax=Channa argus TaxID=215402 RepID=UPI00352307CE
MSLPHPNTRSRRETRQSPFKVPANESIFLLSEFENRDKKEELRKFLALPINEKTTHAEQMRAKLKKELVGAQGEEEVKMPEHVKSKGIRPKQITGKRELKIAMMKRENLTKESKHDLISMERQKAVLELALITKKSEIVRMDEAIAKEERQLKQLERMIQRDNLKFEEFLRDNEKKSVEARTFFEQEAKSKQEKNAEIKRLNAEIGTIKSELTKLEETLMDCKRYKELLFKLSPPEWQEAQRAKAMKAKVPSNREPQDEHNREESVSRSDLEMKVSNPGRLSSIRETSLSSVHSNTLITKCNLDSDSSEYEDEPELYFTDPQQLLDLLTDLTEQNLSAIQNSTRVEETVDELQESMETTRKKIEKDEEQLALQINDMKRKIEEEKLKGDKLKQKVQFHFSLNTDDQDGMLDALTEKVAEVHRLCVDDRMTNLSILEKVANIENRMMLLQLDLESIPKEFVDMIRKIKDSERSSREREEKLREQKEKQKERMRKYLERSLADSKKTSGKKLMPRCMPVTQKVKVSKVESNPAETEFHAYLFTSDDTL